MPSFTAEDILDAIDRRLGDVASASSSAAQAIAISEAVMWLWVLGDTFNAGNATVGDDRARLNGLYFARHKGLHEAIKLGEPSDLYSNYYTDLYGAPVWAALPPAKRSAKNQAEEADYKKVLQGQLILDTLGPLLSALRSAGL